MPPGSRGFPCCHNGSAAPTWTPSAAWPRALSVIAYSVLGVKASAWRSAPRRASFRFSPFWYSISGRSGEHTSELQSQFHLVCRLLLEKKKKKIRQATQRTLEKHTSQSTY